MFSNGQTLRSEFHKPEKLKLMQPNQNNFPNNNQVKQYNVPVKTSFDNKGENSIYKRMTKYCQSKGIAHPDLIRIAVSLFLDKAGF